MTAIDRAKVRNALTVALAVVLVCILISQILGYPTGIAYVTSDSMSPTLTTGDAFISVPAVVTPAPEPGEVVTYRAVRLEGGGLTTHRVVERTEAGYITKGDSNVFTDQGAGEPPVSPEQIVAEPLQIGPFVPHIPYLGTIMGTLHRVFIGNIAGGGASLLSSLQLRIGLLVAGVGLLIWSMVDS